MTPTPLSPAARASLVEKAKAATPGPWRLRTNRHTTTSGEPWGWVSENTDANINLPGVKITWEAARGQANAAFIAAANPSTIISYEATVQALEAKLTVQAGARLAWPQAARDELAAWEEKHDLYVVSSDHHAGFVDQVDRLTVERDEALERVKALEAGLREIVVECASRDLLPNHFRIQIEHLAKGALTPKDPGQ